MGNLNLVLPPPQNWQDFEKLLRGIVDVIWKQEGWQNYGRLGQNQAGIDLYGYDNKRKFTGIQCKKQDLTDSDGMLLTKSLLTEKTITKEILSAEAFEAPRFERFIFATTSSRDTKIQNIIRQIDYKRKKENKFRVEIWFWEDLQIHIEKHIELMYWYYSDLLEKIYKYDKNIHILTMLRQAFTRPVFKRPMLREESGIDFIKAIKDTQEAITSGHLYNRRGYLLTSSFDYHKLTNISWKNSIAKIYKKLEKIRNLYQDGLKKQSIIEHNSFLEFLDRKMNSQFDTLRTECLIIFNTILKEASMELIVSDLII